MAAAVLAESGTTAPLSSSSTSTPGVPTPRTVRWAAAALCVCVREVLGWGERVLRKIIWLVKVCKQQWDRESGWVGLQVAKVPV